MKTGVIASYRDKFILLRENFLTDEQFILYEYCIHQADFDENHIGKFGTFKNSYKELGDELGWSEDKIGRNIKILLKKGLLKSKGNKTFEVVDFYRFIPKYAFKRVREKAETPYLQRMIAGLRTQSAEVQKKDADLQISNPHLDTITPSISDTISSKITSFISSPSTMSDEDIQWIKENVKE